MAWCTDLWHGALNSITAAPGCGVPGCAYHAGKGADSMEPASEGLLQGAQHCMCVWQGLWLTVDDLTRRPCWCCGYYCLVTLLPTLCQVTAEFLAYTASRGNDLSTPAPWANFPGLKPGDRWCLCAAR
jgi:hypothetical protein